MDITFYRKSNGKSPVKDFIDKLNAKDRPGTKDRDVYRQLTSS